eukprot:4938656-Pleurochrysis_carterae.AAC.1
MQSQALRPNPTRHLNAPPRFIPRSRAQSRAITMQSERNHLHGFVKLALVPRREVERRLSDQHYARSRRQNVKRQRSAEAEFVYDRLQCSLKIVETCRCSSGGLPE